MHRFVCNLEQKTIALEEKRKEIITLHGKILIIATFYLEMSANVIEKTKQQSLNFIQPVNM